MKKSCDVLVVGGGVIGLFCAYYLLKAGRGVTLIAQNEVGTCRGSIAQLRVDRRTLRRPRPI